MLAMIIASPYFSHLIESLLADDSSEGITAQQNRLNNLADLSVPEKCK
jgi:hypothetical protein